MPPIMPYTTEKNPLMQVLEDYCNLSPNRGQTLGLLRTLVANGDMTAQPPLNYPTLDPFTVIPPEFPSMTHREARTYHLNVEFFGMAKPTETVTPFTYPTPQKQSDPTGQTGWPWTGFWAHWYGDAEGILRETLIRAFCLSLGLSRSDATNGLDHGTQHWPITLLWKCPQPWFEGWIEYQRWHPNGDTDGHVTVVLSTPAHGVKLYDTPVRPPGWPAVVRDPYRAYEVNPDDRRGDDGLWVVSHLYNEVWHYKNYPSGPIPPTAWGPPVLGAPVWSHGKVVCVSPAVPDGGASPSGMTPVPPRRPPT